MISSGNPSQRAILLERLGDEAFQLVRNLAIHTPGRGGRRVENGIDDHNRCAAGERLTPRRHLVEDDAEREQIRAGVERLAAGLLG
jgi:hypothetical protein